MKITKRLLVFGSEIEMAQFVFKYKELLVPYSEEQIQDMKHYYGKGNKKFDNWVALGVEIECMLEDGRTFVYVQMNGVNFKKIKNMFVADKVYYSLYPKEEVETRFIFKGEL